MEGKAQKEGSPSFGALLRGYRIAAGLSQEALADRARMSVDGISALERGSRRKPYLATLALLAQGLRLNDEQRRVLEDAALGAALPGRRGALVTVGPWPGSNTPDLPPAPTTTFVGREAELKTLEAALARGSIAAIYGLAGVGKSSLAREYAVRNRDRYTAIGWLDAQTEDGVIEGLLGLGATFEPGLDALSNRRAAAQQVVARVLRDLDKPVLLVFDNLEQERHLRTWLPRIGAHAVVTSRHAAWSADVSAIALHVWPAETAIEYLQRESRRSDLTDVDARAIVEALGALPLALAHAATSLRGMRMLTPGRYLEHIGAHLDKDSRGAEYPRSVFATFKAAISEAEHEAPGAAASLCFAALFAPDGIPDELFRQTEENYAEGLRPSLSDGGAVDLHSVVSDEVCLDEALGALDRLSLLIYSESSRTYRVHRLVQLASQDLVNAAIPAWRESAIRVLDAALPQLTFAVWPQYARLVPHGVAVLDTMPDDAAFLPAGRLAHRCASYLAQRGEYGPAQALSVRSLAMTERLLGPYHPDVALSLNIFGIVCRQQGRYKEAEVAHARALAIRERAFGSGDLAVSHSLNNLATTFADRGLYHDAGALHARALAIREKALGTEHPDVAESLDNLGDTYWGRGRLDEALPLHIRALAIREQALGPSHPVIAVSLRNIGGVYCSQGRYQEAEPLLRRGLAIRERTVGTSHPELAQPLIELGDLCARLSRHEEAAAILARAFEIKERALGPDHPETTALREKLRLQG